MLNNIQPGFLMTLQTQFVALRELDAPANEIALYCRSASWVDLGENEET